MLLRESTLPRADGLPRRLTRHLAALAAAVSLLVFAASAAAQPPTLSGARCWSHGHACKSIVPGGRIMFVGRGFQRGMLAVFTIERGGYAIEATRATQWLGPRRLRATVPSDAVAGPVYLLGATTTSNVIELAVHGATWCSSAPGPGDAVHRWQPVIACVLGLLHQPIGYLADVFTIIGGESGGDPGAVNTWDSNAKAGDPSRGLMQVTGATFAAYRSASLAPDILDPAANIYAGLAYGIARYGSIPNIPGVKSANAGGRYTAYRTRAR